MLKPGPGGGGKREKCRGRQLKLNLAESPKNTQKKLLTNREGIGGDARFLRDDPSSGTLPWPTRKQHTAK